MVPAFMALTMRSSSTVTVLLIRSSSTVAIFIRAFGSPVILVSARPLFRLLFALWAVPPFLILTAGFRCLVFCSLAILARSCTSIMYISGASAFLILRVNGRGGAQGQDCAHQRKQDKSWCVH